MMIIYTQSLIKMDTSTAVDSEKPDGKINTTAYLDAMEESNNKYRWYLCTETTPTRWKCEHKTAHDALLPHTLDKISTMKTTTAIPINKFIPTAFDNMILTHNIRSMTHVKVVKRD